MPTKLEELVRQTTVPLTNSAGQLLGTAFFIAPGLAVSAAHVVHGAPEGKVFAPDRHGILRALTVRVQHPPTVAPGVTPYPLPDLALLDAAAGQFEDTPCVLLAKTGAARELLAIGYSKSIDPRSAYAHDVARLEFEAVVQMEGVEVIKVMQATVDPGMSGAPVLDLEAGAVVGLVKATRGAGKPYGAFAVAISELQRYEHSAWGQSELHHRSNATWRAAKADDIDGLDPVSVTRALADAVIREGEARRDALPSGVDANALHQTVWLRHRPLTNDQPSSETDALNFRQRWRSERPLSGLTVVSGDPGFGKSWLLADHAAQVARQALRHLDERGVVDECVIPLRLTCTALGSDPGVGTSARGLARVLVGTTATGSAGFEDDDGYTAVVERTLADGRLLVCLDGLDEMPRSCQPLLKKALLTLLALNNAVLVATRPSALPIIDEIAPGNREDFQLVGFGPRETVNFVRAWHRDRPQAADSLLGAFADRPELAQLAEVPLLLSFLCRLGDPGRRQDYRQTTLPRLFQDVARHLLSGRWRGDRTPIDAEAMPDPILRMRLLADVTGLLQDTWRGGAEDIPKSELRTAIRAHSDYASLAATAAVRMRTALEKSGGPVGDAAEPVLWEFLYDGILVEATDAPLRPCVRFIHPLMREMLLAHYVASLSVEGQFACIDKHRWLDASWVRVIVASASLVTAPSALVSHILSSDGDPWVTQRTLAAQVLAAVPDYRDDETAQAVLDSILESTRAPFEFERRRALGALGSLLHSSSHLLRTWAHNRVARIGESAEEDQEGHASIDSAIDLEVVVSLLEARDAAAVRPAHELLASSNYAQNARSRLISGLVSVNTPEAIDGVVAMLNRPSSSGQDLTSFLAALQPHANLAVAAAVQLLRNRQIFTWARVRVGRALLECGPAGVDTVREVADDRTMSWSIKAYLYAEMLRAAVPDVTAQALHLLASPYGLDDDRAELALPLIEDGATDAIPAAALALSNGSVPWKVREALARALARQGRAGRDLLIAQLNHAALGLDVKIRHICALVEVRDPAGSDAALRLHNDRGVQPWIRMRLAEVLLHYNPGLADEEALIELATLSEEPFQARFELAVDMLRNGFQSAETVLISLLRNRPDISGSAASWPDSFMRIAESGENGRRCLQLVAHAADLDWPLRCEALLSLGKTLGGIAASAETKEIIASMPEIWRSRLILGQARAGIALDLDEFEKVACRLKGGYRIIFEFLLRAPVEWGTAERLLVTARDLQTRGTTEADADHGNEGKIVRLDQSLLLELDVKFRSDAEAAEQLHWIYELLELRVGARIAELMLQEQLDEFEALTEENDEGAAIDFLETSFPEYQALVRETYAEIKAEIKDGRLSPPSFGENSRGVSVVRNISTVASVLAEWGAHASANRWDKWLDFAIENASLIESNLALRILKLAMETDSRWGLNEASAWVARRMALQELDTNMLSEPTLIHDFLKGCLERGDLADLYHGGAYAALRFPQFDFGWWYAALAAQEGNDHRLALLLVRSAGETRPPAEREDGTAILEYFQPQFGWPPELVEEFRAAYIEGKLEPTIPGFERAVAEAPESAQAHFNLGIALQRAGRHEEAADAYRRAMELEPTAVRHRALAGALSAAGRAEEAIAAIGLALELGPNDPTSHTTHGVILGRLQRNEEALDAFREAYRLAPKNSVFSMNLGLALYRVNRFDEAAEIFRQEVARRPRDARRRSMLAQSLSNLGRLDESLHEYTRALEIDSADVDLLQGQGYVLSLLNRHEDAIPPLNAALQLKPDNLSIMANLAFQYWRLQHYDDALELGRQAVTLQPEDPESYRIYAQALHWSGRLEEAEQAIAQGLELASDNLNLLDISGLIFYDQGRYAMSAESLTRGNAIAPGNSGRIGNLGIALLMSGRLDEACEQFRECDRLGSYCGIENDVMLAVAVHNSDPDESVSLAKRALTYGPERMITQFRQAELRAIAFLICGNLESAVAELRAARPVKKTEDVLHMPLYELVREIAPGLVESLLAEWPH